MDDTYTLHALRDLGALGLCVGFKGAVLARAGTIFVLKKKHSKYTLTIMKFGHNVLETLTNHNIRPD